jgi:hypothetical protein
MGRPAGRPSNTDPERCRGWGGRLVRGVNCVDPSVSPYQERIAFPRALPEWERQAHREELAVLLRPA